MPKKPKPPTHRRILVKNKKIARLHGLKLREHGRGTKVPSGKLKRIPLAQLRRDRIKLTRLGLRETAAVLEISAGFYSMIETGKRKPGLKLACKIAEYYGYTVEQIWGRVGL